MKRDKIVITYLQVVEEIIFLYPRKQDSFVYLNRIYTLLKSLKIATFH